jgi:hypothetical protein
LTPQLGTQGGVDRRFQGSLRALRSVFRDSHEQAVLFDSFNPSDSNLPRWILLEIFGAGDFRVLVDQIAASTSGKAAVNE